MKIFVFPTKKQWNNWSLPSRLTAIGTYGGLIGLIFAIYPYVFSNEGSHSKTEEKIKVATQFIEDIERIKVLLPISILLSDCIKNSKENDYDTKFSECVLRAKQNWNDARVIFLKNINKLTLLLDEKDVQFIKKISNNIDFIIYEMQNNQYILEKWIDNDCSIQIDIIRNDKNIALKELSKNGNCMLSVENYLTFINRSNSNENYVSQINRNKLNTDKIKLLIIPGNSIKIDSYFMSMNNELYKRFIDNLLSLERYLKGLINS